LDLLGEPRHQPGLADAGLAANTERDRIADPDGLESGVQTA
jgi:hypothetical protein